MALLFFGFIAIQPCEVIAKKSNKKRPAAKEQKAQTPTQEQVNVLVLVNGEELRGTVTKIDKNKIYFHSVEGKDMVYAKDEVERIELPRARKYDEIKSANEIKDPLLLGLLKSAPEEMGPAQYATLFENDTIILNSDGSWTQRKRVISKVFQNDGSSIGNQFFNYYKKSQTCEIVYAITVNPDGKVHHLAENAINDGSMHNQTPLYENLHELKFGMKEVHAGSVLDFEVEWNTKKDSGMPPYLSELFFDNEPIFEKRITVITPHGKKMKFAFDKNRFGRIEARLNETEEDGNLVTVFSAKNIPPFKLREYSMPPLRDFMPCVTVAEDRTWQDIADFYAAEYAKININAKGIAAKAKELTKNCADNKAKLAAIYEFVARKIRAISVPASATSFIPHAPATMLAEGRANMLDKCFLFVALAKHAGIDANLRFVRFRDGGIAEKDAPSIRQFDSIIVSAGDDGLYAFNSVNLKPGQIPSDLEGTLALDIKSNKNPLAEIKRLAPDYHFSKSTYNITMAEDGSLKIKRHLSVGGENESGLRAWRFLTKEELDKKIDEITGSFSPNAKLIGYSISKLDDFDAPVTLDMEFSISNYVRTAGEDMKLFQLPGMGGSAFTVAKEQRLFPIMLGTKSLSITEVTVEIPKNFRVYFLPKKLDVKNDMFSYNAEFKDMSAQNKIVFNSRYETDAEVIMPDDYATYKKFVENRVELMDQWLVIKRNK